MLSDAEYDILARIELGGQVFRPSAGSQRARDAFASVVARLFDLRDRGLIRLADTRVSRTASGEYLVLSPCDLTPQGRAALARDRRLGPRDTGRSRR